MRARITFQVRSSKEVAAERQMTSAVAVRPIDRTDFAADALWHHAIPSEPGIEIWGGWAEGVLVASAELRAEADGFASFTLVVDPARRRRGIGSAVASELTRLLRSGPIRGLRGSVVPGDRAVRRMLHRAGFQLDSPFPDSRGFLRYRYAFERATPTVPRIKICCISSLAEAHLAIQAGASAVGLVSAMPTGPGVISEPLIAAIARQVPPPTETFLLTSVRTAVDIVAQHRRCGTSTIQICDRLAPGEFAILRRLLPAVSLVQVVHVTGPESVAEAIAASGEADGLLLDSGNQGLAIKELGGTGRVHDWELSAVIREAVTIPVFLAGGLDAGNVAQAVAQVAPWGLDLCSRVRTHGKLDPVKLTSFMVAAGRLPS